MEKKNPLRGEERRVISTKIYKAEFNLLKKICDREEKTINAKLKELVKNEINEKLGGVLER